MLWGRTQSGYEAKVDILLHSVVRASVNILRTRGPNAARKCVFMERGTDFVIYVGKSACFTEESSHILI